MSKLKTFLFAIPMLFYALFLNGQGADVSINVKYISEEITIDGVLDESIWQEADVLTNFWQFFPTDSARSNLPTEVRIMYDDNTIYIGIRAEIAGDIVVSNLRRDFSGASNDNVTLMFDTFKDGTTAFLFGMTPYGVQREAFISEGGSSSNGFNTTWDQKWVVENKLYDDHYVLEAAIPFSSLKFREGDQSWRLQCYRWDMNSSEQSAWARVPQNQMLSSLAFMGEMIFEKPLGKSHTPFTVIPYVNALSSKNFETGTKDNSFKFGGDAKVAIGNSMNLDITVNPDFSNVEVDDIFTNLTRFEVFLPEKRQFFIDNNDLFGNYGDMYYAAKPFFSRRIGLARDKNGNLIENRILGGVRLSGKVNEDWRLGFLNIQTDEDVSNEIASNNNMMLSVQKKVFDRSNIGFFAVNRQAIKDYEFLDSTETYNRVFGAEYNLASTNNSWMGKFYVHKSFQPEDTKGNLSSQATVTYNNRKFTWIADMMYVDKDFKADLGFVPRTGILKSGNGFRYKFYPSESFVNRHGPGIMLLYYWSPQLDYKKTDHTYRLYYDIDFTNQSTFQFAVENEYVYLTYDFDPTRSSGSTPLPGNHSYSFNQLSIEYQSNQAKVVSFNLESSGGEFYNGKNVTASGEVNVRIQPWALLSVNLRYDGIRLPNPYSDADYWLITPKADITFTKSLFWSTLVQYSNQRENLGINSRLQWRFAPLSDLYLVYNDNYYTTDFSPRFRSINLKLTYWLNI